MRAGRPSSYSDEMADKICREIANGRAVHRFASTENYPSAETIRKWKNTRPDFLAKYTRAREEQADLFASEIVDIADAPPIMCSVPSPDGGTDERIDAAGEQWRKTRIDARKWYASKVAPKKYGERVNLEHSGEVTLGLAERISTARKRDLPALSAPKELPEPEELSGTMPAWPSER